VEVGDEEGKRRKPTTLDDADSGFNRRQGFGLWVEIMQDDVIVLTM
jgi:hypothetical protein